MRLLRRVAAEAVVGEWLRAEIASSRFGAGVQAVLERDGYDRCLVEDPDLEDPVANAHRLEVLRELRGFDHPLGVDGSYLDKFPVGQVAWWLAEIGRVELRQVHYTGGRGGFWVEVSDGTRLPEDHVRLLGADIGREPDEPDWIADRIRRGEQLPLMICADAGPSTRIVVVEGHVRLTAYVLAGDAAPARVRVLLGRSPAVVQWPSY